MPDVKTLLSITGVILTFTSYVPYFRDTLRGKTVPHVFTWFIWSFTTVIVFALQISSGAGVGAWITLAAAAVSLGVFVLGMRNGKKDITRSDVVFFALACMALLAWLVAQQPILSIILLATTHMLGFVPTIRKSWNKPHSETLSMYEINTFRHALGLFALEEYSIITWLYPVTWIVANLLFSTLLIVRRKQVR